MFHPLSLEIFPNFSLCTNKAEMTLRKKARHGNKKQKPVYVTTSQPKHSNF